MFWKFMNQNRILQNFNPTTWTHKFNKHNQHTHTLDPSPSKSTERARKRASAYLIQSYFLPLFHGWSPLSPYSRYPTLSLNVIIFSACAAIVVLYRGKDNDWTAIVVFLSLLIRMAPLVPLLRCLLFPRRDYDNFCVVKSRIGVER